MINKDGTTLTILNVWDVVQEYYELIEIQLAQICVTLREWQPGQYNQLEPKDAVECLRKAHEALICISPPA